MTRIRSITALFLAALREIFDEAAYGRYLQRHRAERSRSSYAGFLHEHERYRARRARCC